MTTETVGGRLIGRPLARREDARILSGRSRYLDDIELPELAHLAFVRSPEAHARVTAVRVPQDAPGVIAVLTGQDLENQAGPLPIQAPDGAGTADEPHPVLAGEVVRYVGEPVAAVVAESRALAEDAAEGIEVDYEPLDAVVDPALSQTTLVRWRGEGGDVDGAFAAADEVVSGRYAMPRLAAVPMETRGAVASYSDSEDLLTIWCSAQDTHRQLKQLAAVLGRPAESIRVVIPDVGGAFGSKGALAPEAAVAAVAAMRIGRPVKWAEDRFENFVAAYQGRGVQADVELALTSAGRMLGLRAHIVADLGAYLLPYHRHPASYDGHANDRLLRHSRGPGRRGRDAHQQGAHRSVSRRGASGGRLLRGELGGRRRATTGYRPDRAAQRQPGLPLPASVTPGLDLRLG